MYKLSKYRKSQSRLKFWKEMDKRFMPSLFLIISEVMTFFETPPDFEKNKGYFANVKECNGVKLYADR